MFDSWAEAEQAYQAGNEALNKGEFQQAQVLFTKSQTATWFWIAESMEAARIAFLQFVGELPKEPANGEPVPGGK